MEKRREEEQSWPLFDDVQESPETESDHAALKERMARWGLHVMPTEINKNGRDVAVQVMVTLFDPASRNPRTGIHVMTYTLPLAFLLQMGERPEGWEPPPVAGGSIAIPVPWEDVYLSTIIKGEQPELLALMAAFSWAQENGSLEEFDELYTILKNEPNQGPPGTAQGWFHE